MKKLPLFIAVFFMTTKNLLAQADTIKPLATNQHRAEKLIVQSKKLQTSAWVLLAGGLACTGVGYAINPGNSKSWDEELGMMGLQVILVAGGIGMTAASIPLFIVSGAKKRKANLLLTSQTVYLSPQFKTNSRQFKTGITINF